MPDDTPRWKDTLPDCLAYEKNAVEEAGLLDGLDRYFTDHLETGGYLRAVLDNDLHGALSRAHPISIRTLDLLVRLIALEAPPGSWGTPHKVDAWIRRGDERRESGMRINQGDE